MVISRRIQLVVFLLLVVCLWAAAIRRPAAVSEEAIVTEAVCQQLLANTTEGRQALFSSLWWPPLPVLLRLPLAACVDLDSLPVASLLISALAGVGVLFLLERILRHWRLGRSRFALLAVLLLQPAFLRECCSGSSATTLIFFLMLTAFGMVQWIGTHEVRYLVYMAAGSALLALLSFETLPWLLLLFVLVFMTLGVHPWPRGQKEAVLILVLLPPFYAAGLWFLMNWLIMGDGAYFLHALGTQVWADSPLPREPLTIAANYYAAAITALVLLAVALWRRHRAAGFLALVTLSPLVQALFLSSRGLLWEPSPMLFAMLPLAMLAAAYLPSMFPECSGGRKAAWGVAGLCLAALVLTGAVMPQSRTDRGAAAPTRGLSHVQEERQHWLPKIEAHVRSRSPYAKVFVCGYDSFILLGREQGGPNALFLPTFDFNFYKARHDYHGQNLYLLIHRPVGRSSMESIHWKYDRIFYLGSRWTLHDGDFGDWRLFEIVQGAW